MQEQAVQDAENDFLEKECEHLQKLLEEKNQELVAIQNQSSSSDSQSASPGVSSAASALGSDTNMTDGESSSVPLNPELGLKDHKAMHEAYQFVVSTLLELPLFEYRVSCSYADQPHSMQTGVIFYIFRFMLSFRKLTTNIVLRAFIKAAAWFDP